MKRHGSLIMSGCGLFMMMCVREGDQQMTVSFYTKQLDGISVLLPSILIGIDPSGGVGVEVALFCWVAGARFYREKGE